MADNPEPTESWLTYQPTYLRLYGYFGCTKPRRGDDVWDQFPNEAMVQIEGRTYRFYTDVPCKFVVSRM